MLIQSVEKRYFNRPALISFLNAKFGLEGYEVEV